MKRVERWAAGVVHRSKKKKKTAHIHTAHAKYQSNDWGVSHHGNQGYMWHYPLRSTNGREELKSLLKTAYAHICTHMCSAGDFDFCAKSCPITPTLRRALRCGGKGDPQREITYTATLWILQIWPLWRSRSKMCRWRSFRKLETMWIRKTAWHSC